MSAKREPRVIDSPWMRTNECAAYMKFPSIDAFYKWLQTPAGRKLPRGNRGPRTLMFDRRIVDAFMAGLLKESAKPSPRVLRIAKDARQSAQPPVNEPAERASEPSGESNEFAVAATHDAQSAGGTR